MERSEEVRLSEAEETGLRQVGQAAEDSVDSSSKAVAVAAAGTRSHSRTVGSCLDGPLTTQVHLLADPKGRCGRNLDRGLGDLATVR